MSLVSPGSNRGKGCHDWESSNAYTQIQRLWSSSSLLELKLTRVGVGHKPLRTLARERQDLNLRKM